MKRLIVLTDGTWNSKDAAKADGEGLTNVARMYAGIADQDAAGVQQLPRYHKGVGTGPWWDRIVGGAFGVGIGQIIRECYDWLVANYAPGDELFFFGFSRGAYTARSLVGFVRNCGILRPEHRDMVAKAYDFYRDRSPNKHPRSDAAQQFRDTYSCPGIPLIKCVGVWDTVGALGVPISGPLGWYSRRAFGFHDVQLSSWVKNAFHAIAVDERRRPFEPTLWKVKESDAASPTFTQRIEQHWFPGVHSNIGGGYEDARLSGLTLRWMLDRAADCGLAFKPGVADLVTADPLGTLYDSLTPFYRRVWGQYVRPVMAPATDRATNQPLRTFEAVADKTFERRRKFQPPDFQPSYNPENLRGFPDP